MGGWVWGGGWGGGWLGLGWGLGLGLGSGLALETKARSGAVREARCSGESEMAASMAAPTLVRVRVRDRARG